MLIDYLRLLRVQQWYKNSLVFLALVFSINLFNIHMIYLNILGFVCLCLLFSSTYIFNDIVDRRKDRLHPEKKFRPIASGKINVFVAGIIAIILFCFAAVFSYYLNLYFFIFVLLLALLSLFYTLFFKNEPFVDIIAISINYVIRAISGGYIIQVFVSPWLIVGTFFLAMFLVTAKRRADYVLLGNKASLHKPVLQYYNQKILDILLQANATILIIVYALYCFLGKYEILIITLPIVMYSVFRYMHLVYGKSEIARQPDKIYRDSRILFAMVLWVILVVMLLYLF
jgi:4-hydroxybenzoate polyprenyltransferase